jgi:hypothetical protein
MPPSRTFSRDHAVDSYRVLRINAPHGIQLSGAPEAGTKDPGAGKNIQEGLARRTVTATSGGGMVTVT